MNRFANLLASIQQDPENKDIFDVIKSLDSIPASKEIKKPDTIRMPYSSEPKHLEPAWD